MKHLLTLTMFSLLLFATSFKTNAQKSEEEAIKQTLQHEIISYFHNDYEGWANMWAHDSVCYVVRTGISGQFELMGWNAISNHYKQSIENLSVMDDASIAPFLSKKDFHFYINGNMATVSFKQGNILPNFETSTLIKQNGTWKILNFTHIDNSSYAMLDIIKAMESFMGKNWMAK